MVVIRDVYLTGKGGSRQLDDIVTAYNRCCSEPPQEIRDGFHIGWLGNNTVAILLPTGHPADAYRMAEAIVRDADIPHRAITLCFHQVEDADAPCTFQRGLIGEVRLHRMPWWKRLIDILTASTILFATAPILVVAALAIRLTSPGPTLFRQTRVGAGGRPFRIFKLRTMYSNAEQIKDELQMHNERDGSAFKIENDPRVTPVGRFLRRASIDELPQLINVLRGEMSMVGPRPLPVSEWNPAEGWYALRHDVTPGLTCYWQVDGRCRNVTFDEWMRMDLEYVSRRTFRNDLRLIMTTVHTVLFQRGSY